MAMYFRHERLRPFQKELMEDIHGAISERKTILANAPTGSGKTDAALSAAISCAQENGLGVFFLTPKISQHKIALDVVRGIAEKYSLKLRAADMVGRSHCCIDDALLSLDYESFHTACERKRQKSECMFHRNARGSSRLEEAKAEAKFRDALANYGSGKTHHEVIELGRKKLACPYEWLLKFASVSDVVIADYHHIMIPQVRDIFLMKVKKRVEDSIIIVDEAHNLAPRVRASLSRGMSTFVLGRVEREMRFLGLDSGPLEEEFASFSRKILAESKEKPIEAGEMIEFIGRFGLSLEDATARLHDAGLAFVERTSKKSACLRLARFFAEWEGNDDGCVRILKRAGEHFFLTKKMLDPSSATRILNDCAGAILMSGTLLPMEMHRDVLGLDKSKTVMKSYPSPFDRSNTINIITEELTTKFSKRDAEGYAAIATKLDAIIRMTPGGTAVFFPSYVVLGKVLPLLSSKNLIVQKPGMKPMEIRALLRDFRDGGVLVGVQGGSLSEGVDYCEGEIKTVVIVGVALEEMNLESKALIAYYDLKFGRGWDYGYLYPGTIKALQAAGRARRKDSDRVAIVYMDERFKWGKYNWILSRDEKTIVTDKPERAVDIFWKC